MSLLLTQPDLPASIESLSIALSKSIDLQDAQKINHFAERICAMGGHISHHLIGEALTAISPVPLRALIPYIDPNHDDGIYLRISANFGRVDMVEALLPYCNALELDSLALRWAAENGHLDVVKTLLPYSDPRHMKSEALYLAAQGGHWDVVDLLLPMSEPQEVNDLDDTTQTKLNAHVEALKLRCATPNPAARARSHRI